MSYEQELARLRARVRHLSGARYTAAVMMARDSLDRAEAGLTSLIDMTPSGETRNLLTEANLSVMQARQKLRDARRSATDLEIEGKL